MRGINGKTTDELYTMNMKNANVFRQCLMIYIHRKRPDIKIELEDIDIQKQGIHLNKKNKE